MLSVAFYCRSMFPVNRFAMIRTIFEGSSDGRRTKQEMPPAFAEASSSESTVYRLFSSRDLIFSLISFSLLR